MKSKEMIADLWFYSDDSKGLLPSADSAAEDLYFKYIIARFSAYENVTWNLALEYEEYRTSSWVTKRAQFVKDRDPFDHLLAVHQLPSGTFAFPGAPNLDHTSLQHLGADHATLNSVIRANRNATAAAGRAIPIMHEEFFIEGARGNPDQFRQGIWAITTGGGYYKGASLGFWIGTSYERALHFDAGKRLFEFIVKVPYWEMKPDDSLVSSGYALVNPGKDYLVYLPSGGSVTINLAALGGSLPVKWYDPKTGIYSGHSTTTGGGNKSFTAPFNGDAVLYIGGGVFQGNLPPTATVAADVTAGMAPLTVSFTGTGNDSDGRIASFSWDFGDGSTSVAQNPSHVYRGSGVFDAILKVTDDKGATGMAQVRIDSTGADTKPPIVVIASPADKSTMAVSSVSVTGTIADQNEIPASVSVSVSPSDTNWVFPVLNGTFSGTVKLSSGLNIVSVSATDSAGNFGTASIAVTLSGGGASVPSAPTNVSVR
jgi:PKD repeat protein